MNVREGTLFGLPTKSCGQALGVVSRYSPRGIAVAYFYGPFVDGPPAESPPAVLEIPAPDAAIAILRFGDPALVEGTWPVHGVADNWDRDRWAATAFVRGAPGGRAYVVQYDDHDPSVVRSERRATADEARTLPDDDLYGYVLVENTISRLMSD
ncbi:hypothetical protein [Actinomadura rudentiformis]|uniref:Uncharacterized protein n=1 Tax=Actinomadura rudentiformis TaxID=359158 RepID=A0A6H9Y9R8_9ACTN|nr:hypothetical protein [Actinomadura rudentiformis]KAB2341250.1 hypothetical protein F8566_41760 [Actinomadura rudentiformis]